MAAEAQKIYDNWEDLDFGGGICDEISQSIGGVIVSNIPSVQIVDGGQDGDDHAWVIAHNGIEAYEVDIPPSTYEMGAGYAWEKIPGVIFSPENIIVQKLDIDINELV